MRQKNSSINLDKVKYRRRRKNSGFSSMYIISWWVYEGEILYLRLSLNQGLLDRDWSLIIGLYFFTSGFWPRVRARALRAPVYLSSLPRQPGRCAPPRPSQLRCFLFDSKLNKIYKIRAARVKSFPEINCFPSGSNLSRPRHRHFSFHWTTGSLKYEVPPAAIFWWQNYVYVPVRQYGLTFFVLSFFI